MRVTQKTPDNLVIEEGASTTFILGLAFVIIGLFGVLVGWTKGPTLFLRVGPIFSLVGLYYLLFGRSKTHRFERWRGMLAIDSKNMWGTQRRELPLASIADIVLEEIRNRKAGSAPSYYVYYVTALGERIIWAKSYDGSKENTFDCFHAAREFLGMADPAPVLPGESNRDQPGPRDAAAPGLEKP